MKINEDVFYHIIISYLQISDIKRVMLSGNKKWKKHLESEIKNKYITLLFDPVLRELIHSEPEYDIDNLKSSKSMVIGRNYWNNSKTDGPYIRITIYLAHDHVKDIHKMSIRDYLKDEIILFNGCHYIASNNIESYIHLSDYYGVGILTHIGINQIKELLKNRVIDIKDNMNSGYIARIKYL